jgi:hypothetical protein
MKATVPARMSLGSRSCPAGGTGLNDATGRSCELNRGARLGKNARGLPVGEQVYALIAFDRNGAAAGYVTVLAADLAGRRARYLTRRPRRSPWPRSRLGRR